MLVTDVVSDRNIKSDFSSFIRAKILTEMECRLRMTSRFIF